MLNYQRVDIIKAGTLQKMNQLQDQTWRVASSSTEEGPDVLGPEDPADKVAAVPWRNSTPWRGGTTEGWMISPPVGLRWPGDISVSICIFYVQSLFVVFLCGSCAATSVYLSAEGCRWVPWEHFSTKLVASYSFQDLRILWHFALEIRVNYPKIWVGGISNIQ